MEEMEQALQNPDNTATLTAHLLPSDAFYLAAEFRKKFPREAAQAGPANRELDALVAKDPEATSPRRLATDFGVPHPILADSYSCALITSEPFPVAGGYGSRLFGESWESSNLYWARLADEKGYPPAMLNILVPELTRQMVANISATSIDDWPALLRAMQQTGEEFRQGKDQYSHRKHASKQSEHREWGKSCRIENTGSSSAQWFFWAPCCRAEQDHDLQPRIAACACACV